MKRLYKSLLPVLLAGCFLFTTAVCFAAQKLTIGIIDDCRATTQPNILEQIKSETLSLTKGEFIVRFPSQYHRISDCSEQGLRRDINKMMSDPDIDLIITLGPLGSHLLGRMPHFSKPCIAGIIVNSELQGIPYYKGKSGKDNFSYILLSPDLKGNITQLKEVSDFKKAAFLYDRSLDRSLSSGNSYLEKLTREIQTDIITIPVDKSADPVIKSLDESIDAVILTDLVRLNTDELNKLISYFNQNSIASFSLHDRALVEKGLLAGFDRTSVIQKFSRRIAIMTQRVLLDENPKDFKVEFTKEDQLVLNMQTARQLGISPGFTVLAKAELINQKAKASKHSRQQNERLHLQRPFPFHK